MMDFAFVTLEEVLEGIDSLKPNSFSREEKVGWLSALDGQIFREIIAVHEGAVAPSLPYDPNRGNCRLLVSEPYGRELYLAFLENTMDHYNGDTLRFNNSLERFAALYNNFFRRYHSDHLPLGGKRKFW